MCPVRSKEKKFKVMRLKYFAFSTFIVGQNTIYGIDSGKYR